MTSFKNTINWFFKITKDNFGHKPNKNITINDFKDGLNVMTFNIRRDVFKDGVNNWTNRRESIVKMICDVTPDIICMQEVMPHMAKYLKSQLCEFYDCRGLECFTGGELTKSWCIIGEGLLTLYRKDRFQLKDTKKIKLFDGRFVNVRRAFSVQLYDNFDGTHIDVINTHFCHLSDDARNKSFKKIFEYWANTSSDNYFICGDFNCELHQTQSGIELFSNTFTHNKADEDGSINFFSGRSGLTIDFIFSNLEYKESNVIRDSYNGTIFLSDHWPILNRY